MRTVVVSALMFAALAVAGAAVAQTQDQTQAPGPAETAPVSQVVVKKKADDEGLVCHRERVTGSNRSTKVCTTALQRDLDKDAARRLMDDRAPVANEPVGDPPK